MQANHEPEAEPQTEWNGVVAAPEHVRMLLNRLRALTHGGNAPAECLRCGGTLRPLMTMQRCLRCADVWPLAAPRPTRAWDRFTDGLYVTSPVVAR